MSKKRVVVTGLSAITPLGGDVVSSWDALLAGKSDGELKDIFKMLAVAADCSVALESLRREKRHLSEALEKNAISNELSQHRAPSPSSDLTVDYSDLKKALAEERRKTEAIVGSLSWRITAPLRAAMQRLKNAPPAGDIISAPETDESPANLYRALEIERQKVTALIGSLSWRLTGPLRKILTAFGRPPAVVSAGPVFQAPVKPQTPAAPVNAAKKAAKYQYTVVTACYNVENYLNDYFASLVNQSISFADHIRLILVDDGSTDGTAEVIRYWQGLYPENITYVYQENAGQGTASNRGLELVTTPWVTLLDGDDFVDEKYFETIDAFLQKNHNDYDPARQVKLIGCNLIFYIENERVFKNNHALRSKFAQAETILPYNSLGNLIQLSASSAFFSVAELRRQKRFYTEDRWPLFEDGSLISQYLSSLDSGLVAMLANAKYYYRRRTSQNSLNNQSATNKKTYLDVVEDGYLKCLSLSAEKNNGVAKSNIQTTVLYDLAWRILALRNRPLPYFMTAGEGRKCLQLMRSCFKYINRRVIESFPVQYNGFNFSYKVGVLACFKNMDPTFQIAYIKEYDKDRRTLLLEYYCRETGTLQVIADDSVQLKIIDVKNTPQTILGERFCYMVYAMVTIPENSRHLTMNIGETITQIALNDKHFKDRIEVKAIEKEFAAPPHSAASEQYEGAWVLMDRKFQADDNAEHLYRYIAKNYPERHIFYALLRDSEDWPRLQREGFNMVDPSSDTFKHVLQGCGLIVSSHPDECFTTAVPNIMRYKRLVFLQHGVISQDLSQWLNFRKIDIFITSTRPEYESIVAAQSPYRYSGRRVKMTGLARHDALVPHIGESENLLLVMPTWRNSLQNTQADVVFDSKYARAWGGFLKSARLKELSDAYGFSILFHPHVNMHAYIDGFDLPDYIQLPSSGGASMQEVFKKAAIMVSDYSSCVFEMAFLKKSVLHYQFDRDEVLFGNAHTYTQGYFDYYRDGFGPVAETEDALLDELEKIMARGGEPEPAYLERMEQTFPWRDGNNCERIYQEILKLEQPLDEGEISAAP